MTPAIETRPSLSPGIPPHPALADLGGDLVRAERGSGLERHQFCEVNGSRTGTPSRGLHTSG